MSPYPPKTPWLLLSHQRSLHPNHSTTLTLEGSNEDLHIVKPQNTECQPVYYYFASF